MSLYVWFEKTCTFGLRDYTNAEKARVFSKFYRVGNEDTRKTRGTGLGLYIVKRFVEIYKGEISIEDNKPVGSVFKLSFPKEFSNS